MEVDILKLGGWVNGGGPSLGGLIWRACLSLATEGLENTWTHPISPGPIPFYSLFCVHGHEVGA